MKRGHIPEKVILSHIAAETSKPAQIPGYILYLPQFLYKPRSTNSRKATLSTQMSLFSLETMR